MRTHQAPRLRPGRLVLPLLFSLLFANTALAAGLMIDVPDRVDAIYDGRRGLVYISTSAGGLLRYDVAGRQFLSPLPLSAVGLLGLTLSPDGSTLAVADRDYTGGVWDIPVVGSNWIHLVDLDTWTARRIEFARQRGEVGTYMIEFVGDDMAITTSSFAGSGWVPMRRVDLVTDTATEIASVRQGTMLSTAADGSALFYTESNISSGEFGVYDAATGTFDESGTGWFNFEAAANRDATQFAVPSYNGMFVYDSEFALIERIGVYARMAPVGVAYHPTEDVVYTAWWGTNEAVQAYDTSTLTPLGVIDDGFTLRWSGNSAFQQGRTRISRDGSGLTVTVPGGVKLYAPITFIDDDPDADGVVNRDDNCPDTPNPDQADSDSSGTGDACNDAADRDGDEWEDALDLCPDTADPSQNDTDGNGTGDACNDAEDADGDDWAEWLDNCPAVPNDQADRDADSIGDACDPFPDRGDHVLAQCEVDLNVAQARVVELESQLDICRMPLDADGDGVPDDGDVCPATGSDFPIDADGCSHAQFCAAIDTGRWRGVLECVTGHWSGAERWSDGRCRLRWSSGLTCGLR